MRYLGIGLMNSGLWLETPNNICFPQSVSCRAIIVFVDIPCGEALNIKMEDCYYEHCHFKTFEYIDCCLRAYILQLPSPHQHTKP